MLDVEKLVAKSYEAFEKRNYDYAIDLARQTLEVKIDHPKARQILRTSTIKRYEIKDGVPSGIGAVLSGFIPLIKITFNSILSKNPIKMINACESYLAKNPASIKTRIKLGNALKNMNFIDSAIGEFEGVLTLDSRNVVAAKALGELYRTKKDIPKAEQYYKMVIALNPADLDTHQELKNLAAMNIIQEGGWSTARSSRDVIRDKAKSAELERAGQIVKTGDIDSEIQRLQKLIQQDPKNITNLKKTGELYIRKKDFTNAQKTYQQAIQQNPSDASLSIRLGDIKLMVYDMGLQRLKREFAKNPGDTSLKQKFEAKRREKLKFQVEEYQRRIKAHPTDMRLRYQLGVAFYLAGQIDGAIAEFQNATRDPKRRIESYNYLGRCFILKKHFDLAITEFTKSLQSGALTTAQTKDIQYNLASAYELSNNREAALSEYKKIMEVDFNYKDIAKRVEQLK